MNSNETVLVTGGAGFVGSRLSHWILDNTNYDVVVVDDLSGGYKENVPEEAVFVNVNVGTKHHLERVFDYYKPDIVHHTAAYCAEGLSPYIRMYNYKNNIVATANVINNCIKYDVDRLVFYSSMAVYGDGNPPFHEDDRPDPIDPYGIAKYACEMDIQVANEQHGLDYCIIRPHNIFGPGQNLWDPYRNVLGIWMYQKLHDEPFTIYGDGKQKRAFSYIGDILEPMWKASVNKKASKEIINLGGTKECSINEACDTLSEVVGGNEKKYLEERHEVKKAWVTYEKSQDLLNYKHETSLKEGLKEMWEWAKEQPERERQEWTEFELEKGIYDFWK